MIKLLIDSGNSSLSSLEQIERVVFKKPSDTDVDAYISEMITNDIEPLNPDLLFIKYSLGNDYLEFLGLRLAHHIRLHESSSDLYKVPIIFVGEETVLELTRLTSYSDILGTSGIYFVNENLDDAKAYIDRLKQGGLGGLAVRDNYLDRVHISPPKNYDTRHNYINELSLYLWSEYLGLENIKNDVKARVEYQLYFKYRIEKEKIERSQSRKKDLFIGALQSKVMLIDDEAEKGWGNFYQHLFTEAGNIVFNVANFDKYSSESNIIKECQSQIVEFNPDVILLDLRLSDRDGIASKAESFTGYQLLRKIKEFNKGIQVIVTTASNKTSTFRELNKAGADDFIIKDAEAEASCTSLIEAIESSIQESKISKPIHTSLSIAIDFIQNSQLKKLDLGEDSQYFYDELKAELISYLSLVEKLLNNQNNDDRFSIAVLQMHKCLEVISDYYIEEYYNSENQSHNYEFYTGEQVYHFNLRYENSVKCSRWKQSGRMSALQKFFNIYKYFAGREKRSLFLELQKLNDYRNSYSHPNLDQEFTRLEFLFETDFKEFRKSFMRLTGAFFEILNALR